MKPHVLEFLRSGLKITKARGHLVVLVQDDEIKIPLDDVFSALILSEDILISTNVVTAFVERNIPILFCDGKYNPVASLINYFGHHLMQRHQNLQIALSENQKGRLWQKIIKNKISNQAALLKTLKKNEGLMSKFIQEVEVHDQTNIEAQAAKYYWRALFGSDFRRDQNGGGVNSFLNYGYAILRSAVARYVATVGLSPLLGIHHSNQSNPFCLIDDLMEPFRPLVDNLCYHMKSESELNPEVKKKLASVLLHLVNYKNEEKALSSALSEYSYSFLSAVIEGDYKTFDLEFQLNFYDV